jgi:hypothetical protein
VSRLIVRVIVGLAAAAFLTAFHFGARHDDAVKTASAVPAATPQPAPPAAPRLVLSRVVLLPALGHVAHHRRPVAHVTAAPTPTPTPPAPPTGEQPAPGEQGATPGATVPEASDDATAGGQSGTTTPTPENEGDSQTSPTPTPSPGATTTPGNSGTIASWPSGKTAWTVILESATSKSAADAKANEFSSDGTSVGVLHSDDFSSLNKGYWVVFSGTYDSKSAAEGALDGLKAKVPEAYVRHVVPN